MPRFRRLAVATAFGLGLIAVAGIARAQSQAPATPAAPATQGTTKQIIVVPPLQWDSAMATFSPIYHHVPNDVGRLTNGILFGMRPREVNALLAQPVAGISWSALPLANEFPEDVRYFWIRLADARGLQAGVTSCVGEGSYLVFLFRSRGLFRISYRLVPDKICPSVSAAATAILAHYAVMGQNVVISMRYRNGNAEVVDIVDPGAGYLVPIRWQTRRR